MSIVSIPTQKAEKMKLFTWRCKKKIVTDPSILYLQNWGCYFTARVFWRRPIVLPPCSLRGTEGGMLPETGALKTMPAPSFIPLDGRSAVRSVHAARHYRHQHATRCYIKWTQLIWTKGYQDYPSSGRLMFSPHYNACITYPLNLVQVTISPDR